MTTPQAGILAPIPGAAVYLTFSLADAARARAALTALAAEADGDHLVVGLGPTLVSALGATVPGLRPFPAIAGARVDLPSSRGDLWCWLRGDARGELFHRARRLARLLQPAFRVEQSTEAFRHLDFRDLSGYEDGTENPQAEAAVEAAIATGLGAGLDGSSFVAVQLWQHAFDQLDAMSAATRNNTIGRRRDDNEELAEAPVTAHVKRSAQESFAPAAFVVRRSMPWTDGLLGGLVFVAFGATLAPFEAILRRMSGAEDGIVDGLFTFTRPLTGTTFWCPPIRDGHLDLRRLDL